ncbi:MAG: sigma-70 family RNA polymerase sigma factor [Chitinophagaceae bacterium]|nr:MAG: sigma-70 family RNA polymerase sigma factor [Chitinophagaceae bacterium]
MESPNRYTDKMLFAQVASSNEQAFKLLFDRYWSQVYGTTLHLIKKTEEARDLSQDIFVKLWENRTKLEDIDNPSGYIYRMSRNLVLDYLRKKVFATDNIDYLVNYFQSTDISPQENAEYKELHLLLEKAVDTLPGKVKDVFVLSRQKGLTHEQIAHQLEISSVSSKTYIVRALQMIRKYMETHSDTHILIMIAAILSKS